MNKLEKFCVQLLKYQNKLIPEQRPGDRNPLFDLVYNIQLQTPLLDALRNLLRTCLPYFASVLC
jgi:hypothetical protein